MTSIRHFPATHPLPDWRNLGVMLRTLLGVNLLGAALALAAAPDVRAWPLVFVAQSALLEPVLLLSLGSLAALRDGLRRLQLRWAQLAVLALVLAWTGGFLWLAGRLALLDSSAAGRPLLLALLMAVTLLAYFEWRAQVHAPALAEARLAALNARIRPHFLFNSLNAVLSLVRGQPQQAEMALEALCELFRAALRDPGEWGALADEIALGQQYLALEQLRLGERLAVDWQIGPFSPACRVPPLMLQPLLENAVYHGIEPSPAGGTVRVEIVQQGDLLRIQVSNPCVESGSVAGGHQMALNNIRERLGLYFDLEASLRIDVDAARYRVTLSLPCSLSQQ